MLYLIIVLVAFVHIGFMIRAGYDSKEKDKKRMEKLLLKIFFSSLLASVLTAALWFLAPVTFTHNRVWLSKVLFIFIPAFYFIGVICVYIGMAVKKVSKK